MARSGYSAATMTVTLTEKISLNNKDYGSTQSFTIASVANISRRIVTVTTTEATIMTFSTAMAAGQSIPANCQYVRFTNLDDTNHLILTFANENDDEFAIKLDAGRSLFIAGDVSGGLADMFDALDSALSLSLGDFKSITADADTGSCDMEVFVAETA